MTHSLCLFLILVVSLHIYPSGCTSNGVDVGICDAYFPNFGCTRWEVVGGVTNRLKCLDNVTKTMYWAAKSVRTDDYRLRVGVDEENPVTTYYPGELLDVHIRVMTYGKLYRGILLYADSANNVKVGDWIPFDAEPELFWNPYASLPAHACQNAMMHTTATWKPYHVVFKYKAPPAGTGKITFKCLIKYGDANTGNFYWPNLAGDVTVEEAAPREQLWFRTSLGQSCEELCGSMSKKCNSDAMNQINAGHILERNIMNRYACNLPILSGCSSLGPTSGSDGFCYYYDSNCTGRANSGSLSCSSKSNDEMNGYRFCACGDNIVVNTNPTGVVTETTSSSNRILIVYSLLLLCLFFLAPKNGKTMIFALLVVIALMNGVSAHNWINTPSRSPQANTFSPCLPQRNEKPHVQVGPNQDFQIEWMTGHEQRKTYFVILHAKDAAQMKRHNDALLDDYFRNAPNGSNTINALTAKYHRKNNNNNSDSFFSAVIDSTDPNYIPRPDEFKRPYSAEGFLFSYNTTQMTNDFRVSYASTKYPWIEAVYRFEHARHMPSEFDVARFYIPGRAGYGRYIVHYVWAGYRDCIDVDYMNHTIQYPYGLQQGPDVWQRIDHCYFPQPQSIRTRCWEVTSTPHHCISSCSSQQYPNCYGVNVQRLKNPSTVFKDFQANNPVPWDNANCNQTINDFKDAPDDTLLCYALIPRTPTDVIPEYVVSLDPEDPVFYSTCYIREKNIIFEGYDDASSTSNETSDTTKNNNAYNPWRYHDKCISCEDQKENALSNVQPEWVLSDKCINCDVEPSNNPVAPLQWTLVRNNAICDGMNNGWSNYNHHTCPTNQSCTKRLLPRGSPVIKPEDCIVLARRDPQCSNHVMSSINTTNGYQCHCYLKNLTCCLNCSARFSSTYNIFEIDAAPADPTCATGIRSADNAFCCSGSCGAGKCLNSTTAALASVGFCHSIYNSAQVIPNSRPCTLFGPPCKL